MLPTDTWDNPNFTPCSKKDEEYKGFWDRGGAEKYRDAPVNLQLVGKRLQEERLLAVVEVVEKVVREIGIRDGGEVEVGGEMEDGVGVQSRL